jgi:hypothetical protein
MVDVVSLCAVVEESVNPVVPPTASSARTAPATPTPRGDHLLVCTLARNVGIQLPSDTAKTLWS